ncbi:hypothetical protein PoB_001479800 [Plakobranchus ocellatus]|uniref:Uncharacterized protein n=1 Tax=Plakobranchus ocellatus TaxID=259542 RepID=A0AAV3Z0I6_9GAST|nr:hypothetical protein PoB_001479800 [Plakobranchus ocellatus]
MRKKLLGLWQSTAIFHHEKTPVPLPEWSPSLWTNMSGKCWRIHVILLILLPITSGYFQRCHRCDSEEDIFSRGRKPSGSWTKTLTLPPFAAGYGRCKIKSMVYGGDCIVYNMG